MFRVCFVKKLLLARIVWVLCSVLVFLTVRTTESPDSFKTPLQTTYLERRHLDGTIEHFIITRYSSPGRFPVESVLKITPDGIRVLDALLPLFLNVLDLYLLMQQPYLLDALTLLHELKKRQTF